MSTLEGREANKVDGQYADRIPRVFRAAAWMGGALASFTLIAVAGREASGVVSTGSILFYRSWMALALLVLLVLASGRGFGQFRTSQFGGHCLRSAVHLSAQYWWLYALALIPLAELFAIEFTAPLWTALMAPLLLGERLSRLRLAAVVLGFAGALIVVRPGSAVVGAGTAYAFLAAIGFAIYYVITKRLLRRDAAFTVIFYMTLLQTVLSTILFTSSLDIPDRNAALWIFVIAAGGLTAHFSIARAFALADAIIVTPMDFLRLPLIALVGVMVYNEPLNPWVLAGGAVVVAANFLNIWSERRPVV